MDDDQSSKQYEFLKTKAHDARGTVRWYLLPFMILIRPGRFMLSWGIHANLFWIFLAAWIVGAGRMTNWVVNQQRFSSEPMPFKIESWTLLFVVLLVLGLARGAVEYGLGGAWTWLRLRICGIKGNEWNRSTKIYLFSRMIEMVPMLLLLVYFATRYTGLSDYINQPVGLFNYIVGAFFFISPVVAFIAVLSCYRVRKVWALILFLLWPLFWRVALMVTASMFASSTNRYMGAYPNTSNPQSAQSSVLSFDYPQDWIASFSADSQPIEATVTSVSELSSLVIRVQPRDEFDLIQYDLSVMEDLGYQVSAGSPAPNVRIEHQSGNGVDYKAVIDDKEYKVFHLLVPFDVDHDVLFRFIATERYWWHAMEGWKQVLRTISIGDLYNIVPDIQNPTLVEREAFRLEAPGNWNVGEQDSGPFNTVELSAKQYSWMTVSIYDRDLSPQKKLDMLLNHSIDDELVSHRAMNTWLGLTGVGRQGKLRETLAGDRSFKALFVQLKDGRVLVIEQFQAESSAPLTDPGFELIESTFQLLVEPATNQP